VRGQARPVLLTEGADLRLVQFGPSTSASGVPTVVDDIALTTDTRLDPESRPAWYIPSELLPEPSVSPEPSASGATTSASPSP